MMRILIILLLLFSEAQGQVIINASAPYRFLNQDLLLDSFPNSAGAYSLRKLDKDYAGSAIRIRKDTTGQPEQDIGFTNDGWLDTAAIKSFINARSAYVVTWYDQSGNSRNITQSVQADQPRIANTGVIYRQNTKPCVVFDGSSDYLAAATSSHWTFLHSGGKYTVFTVAKAGLVTDPEAAYLLWGTTLTTLQRGSYLMHDTRSSASRDRVLVHVIARLSDALVAGIVALNSQTAGSTPANTMFLSYVLGDPDNATTTERSAIATNSASVQKNATSDNTSWNAVPFHPLQIGAAKNSAGVNTLFLNGSVSEVIFYSSDQSSNRTSVSNNINLFYAIY